MVRGTRFRHTNIRTNIVKPAQILAIALGVFLLASSAAHAQMFGGSTQSLANPQKVKDFFDSTAFYLIKTVGLVVSVIALVMAIFAAKFGRGSAASIATVCFYIALLFLAPSIVQLISLFTGIGF